MKIRKDIGRILVCVCCFFCSGIPIYSQYSLGTSGLLTTPSADMHPDGTFTVGGNYIPVGMLPPNFDKNTGNYFVNLTFMPFMEVTYRCTLEKLKSQMTEKGYWSQDRSVSLRLRLLKEKKWIPGVVVGSNDAFTTYELNPFSDEGTNRFFSSIYGVVSKSFPLGGHRLGLTAGYYLPVRKEKTVFDGPFGGITYTPAFLPEMDVMADYDGTKVSAGASALLFRHIRVHLLTYGFKEIAGGLRYEFILIPHKQKAGNR